MIPRIDHPACPPRDLRELGLPGHLADAIEEMMETPEGRAELWRQIEEIERKRGLQ